MKALLWKELREHGKWLPLPSRRGRAWQLAHETGSLPPLEAGRGPPLRYPRPRFRDQLESDALIKYVGDFNGDGRPDLAVFGYALTGVG